MGSNIIIWGGHCDTCRKFLTKLVEPVYLISCSCPSWLKWFIGSPVSDKDGWTGLPGLYDLLFLSRLVEPVYLSPDQDC